jgi:hypothetical protein
MISLAFASKSYGVEADANLYLATITDAGAVTWESSPAVSYSTINNTDSVSTPVRIVAPSGSNSTVLEDIGDEASPNEKVYMHAYRAGTHTPTLLTGDYSTWPQWEEFDIHSDGVAIAINCSNTNGYELFRSTDFGVTWSAAYHIDYLHTLLGDTLYKSYTTSDGGVSVQVDEETGKWSCLVPYKYGTDLYRFILLKSSDGLTWTKLKEWERFRDPESLYLVQASLAVSGGYLYVYLDDTKKQFCEHSSDDGATWTETDISLTDTSPISLAAYKNTVMAYCPVIGATDSIYVMKSIDAGLTWTQSLRVTFPDVEGTFPYYQVIRASGGIFAMTFCHARYPHTGGTWTDSNGAHSLDGAGTEHLCFWLSTDLGVTWILEESPILASDRNQQSLDINVSVAVIDLQPINPYVMLQYSNDGGFTWSKEYWLPVGRVGEFQRRLKWTRLGHSPNRVFRFAVSDPCKWIFTDCIIDQYLGLSRN